MVIMNNQVQKEKQTTKLVEKKDTGCRDIHFSVHSPNLKLEFCKNCDGYVQVIESNICSCCKKKTGKVLKYTWLSRVLKFGVKQHHNFLKDWILFPDQGITVGRLKEPYVWEQELRDPKTHKRLIDKTTGKVKTRKILVKEGFKKPPKHSQYLEVRYRDTVYQIEVKYLALALEPIEDDAKLALIKKHVGIKGLRIWIPAEEQMDMKCKKCTEFLKYDNDDNVFCPYCDRIDKNSFK